MRAGAPSCARPPLSLPKPYRAANMEGALSTEPPATNVPGLLHNLALIYIALAHSTDEELSDPEVETIAGRLRAWQHVRTETVASALKEALDDYVKDDADKRVRQAVFAIRDALPEPERQHIVDDLMEVALADGRFLFDESSFIGELAGAWNVRAGEAARARTPWSILNGDHEGAEGWSHVHDLALIYVTLAHSTDDDLSDSEVDAIVAKLHEWMPSATEKEVLHVVRDALTVYAQGRDQRSFTESVEALRDSVPSHQRGVLLEDLRDVAAADGGTSEGEERLIDRLARAWGLSGEE